MCIFVFSLSYFFHEVDYSVTFMRIFFKLCSHISLIIMELYIKFCKFSFNSFHVIVKKPAIYIFSYIIDYPVYA